ncbi:MAG TPA: rhodanese-like domain-containing protein, partial [Blastocatellia bacterium]|nr:rhodanese-like domain-containing protein [Blastocatellia bacterium]
CGSAVARQAAKLSKGDGVSASPSHEAAGAERITVDELKAKLAKKEPVIIIDVRGSDYDASATKIKGAMRIAPAELGAHLKDLPRDKEIVTYCACSTDGGALHARQVLLENGFKNVRALKGGWNAWNQAEGAVEPK